MTIVTDRSMSRPSGASLPSMNMTSGGRRSVAADVGKRAMKTVLLGAVVAITATLAHAEDMAETISRYRLTHGLSAVKTDPQLTAIAERQAKAMAASGVMDHNVAGSFAPRISRAPTDKTPENKPAGDPAMVAQLTTEPH